MDKNKDIFQIDGITYNFVSDIQSLEPVVDVELLEQASESTLSYIVVASLTPFKCQEKPLFKKKVIVDKDTSGKVYYSIYNTLPEDVLDRLKDFNLEWDTNEYFVLNKKSEEIMGIDNYDDDDFAPIYKSLGLIKRKVVIEHNCDCQGEVCTCDNETLPDDDKEFNTDDLIDLITTLPYEDKEKVLLYIVTNLLSDVDITNVVNTVLDDVASDEEGESESELIADSKIKHISAKQQVANRIRRKNPKVAMALKKRRMRNAKCPKGMSWSSKTNSCRLKDPKRQLAAKRAAMYRMR